MMPSSDDSWNKYTFCTGNTLAPIAQVKVKEKFPFDLAFSMTVHKAQGRTIKRVVVDLTDHPYPICRMKYAAVFVATSRIKKSKHIRLLEPITVQNRKKLYEYLPTLIPDPSIAPFLHGYSGADDCPWNPNRALSYTKLKTMYFTNSLVCYYRVLQLCWLISSHAAGCSLFAVGCWLST